MQRYGFVKQFDWHSLLRGFDVAKLIAACRKVGFAVRNLARFPGGDFFSKISDEDQLRVPFLKSNSSTKDASQKSYKNIFNKNF
jgi:hypothetical protein